MLLSAATSQPWDAQGCITDRRAGRIPTELSAKLCERLRAIAIPGAEFFVQPEEGYRFLLVVRGAGLSAALTDSDPQTTGQPPRPVRPRQPEAAHTAELVNRFIARAHRILADEQPANAILLRGFAERPSLPSLTELYGLRPAAIAVYPVYHGLARLAGMTVLDTGTDFTAEVETLREHRAEYDFFYVHYKWTDSAGEDGDFDYKVALLEAFDAHVPALLDMAPDVLVIAGDHSTPAVMATHSWHPVPFLLHATTAFPDHTTTFSERACMQGGLGRFPATAALPLMLAHAGKLAQVRVLRYGHRAHREHRVRATACCGPSPCEAGGPDGQDRGCPPVVPPLRRGDGCLGAINRAQARKNLSLSGGQYCTALRDPM